MPRAVCEPQQICCAWWQRSTFAHNPRQRGCFAEGGDLMARDPKNADEAMAIIREWIEAAAKTHGRELDATCGDTFEKENLKTLKGVFSETNWAAATRNLSLVTDLH